MLFARLELKQTQRLVITPQLQQAIKLLQLSSLDLQAYIENEVRENPLLLLEENKSAVDETREPERLSSGELDLPAFDGREKDAPDFTETWTGEAPATGDGEDAFAVPSTEYQTSDWHLAGSVSGESLSGDYDPLEGMTITRTLGDHLREQAYLAFKSPVDRFVAEYLIDLVDAGGYIRSELNDVAAMLALDIAEVQSVLSTLQTFDPPGVCAQNLSGCLAIQLREKNRLDPCMQRLLDHLPLLASCEFPRLRRLCGVDDDDFVEMIAEIRSLNPRPGAGFQVEMVETMVPDVIVKRGTDGAWKADLNPSSAPALAVDRAYYASLKARCRSETDRTYLSERMSAANWLAKSLEQRLTTILKVATAVVEEQVAFFDQGVRHLKPLNLRQIATKIGMHESTVSRVTSNKAMATPRGVFEMRYFFTSAIAAAGPASTPAHSSEAVRDRIRQLIATECNERVLSDDRIVTLLKSDGIDIARRTVAKYRETLRIPSSAARRRLKRVRNAA